LYGAEPWAFSLVRSEDVAFALPAGEIATGRGETFQPCVPPNRHYNGQCFPDFADDGGLD
jgi:hypothetical protein